MEPNNINPAPTQDALINTFLQKTDNALTNAQGNEILPLLEKRGITKAAILAHLADNDALRALHQTQRKEYSEQFESTQEYDDARANVREEYQDHLTLARVQFRKDIAARTALGLSGARARSQSGYAGQGLIFYTSALKTDAYKEGLATRGIAVEDLETGKANFTHLLALSAAQNKETGDAQAATHTRDEAYDKLADWMTDFYEVARVALRKHPQLREQLGMKEV